MKSKIITIILIAFFSAVLWGSVSLNGEFVATVKMPVNYLNLPDGYIIDNYDFSKLTLTVKGTGWDIVKIMFSKDGVYDVPVGRAYGKHEVLLKSVLNRNTWITNTLEVLDIFPDKIEYDIERLVSKKVKLLPDIQLGYKDGFGLVSDIKVEPDSIVVTGPESKINQLQYIKAKPIVLANLERKVSTSLSIEKISTFDYSTEDVKVNFDVQKIVNKTFDNIIVEQRGVPTSKELLLMPSKITVVLSGGISILGKMTNSDIKVYVNFDDVMKDNSGSVEPIIEVPNTTKILDVKPKKLDYIIKRY